MSVKKFQERLIKLIIKYYQDYNIYEKLEHYHKYQALLEASNEFLTKDQKNKLKNKFNRIHPLKKKTTTKSPESKNIKVWYNISSLRKMNAKYSGKCAETGTVIDVGETCLFETKNRKVYCKNSDTYRNWKNKKL